MSKPLNDNLDNLHPKSLDQRQGKLVNGIWSPFDNITEAQAAVPIPYRHRNLVQYILKDGISTRYRYRDDVITLIEEGPGNISINTTLGLGSVTRKITLDGTFGKGQIPSGGGGQLIFDTPIAIPKGAFLAFAFINIIEDIICSDSSAYITMGIDTDDPTAVLNDATGLITQLNTNIITDVITPTLTKATNDRIIITEIFSANDLTAGVIEVIIVISDMMITQGTGNGNGGTPIHPDGIESYGYVSWSGSGLTYNVTPGIFWKNNIKYNIPAATLTQTPADLTFPRKDLFVADIDGTYKIITGIPAAVPIDPQLNIATQFALTYAITINPGATVPPLSIVELIYDEGVGEPDEWTGADNGGITIDRFDPTNSYIGSKNTAIAAYVANTRFYWYNNVSLSLANDDLLNFHIYISTVATKPIYVSLFTALDFATQSIRLSSFYGFNPSLLNTWQNIVIPASSFVFINGNSFKTVNFDLVEDNSDNSQGFKIDFINIQKNLNIIPNIGSGVNSVTGNQVDNTDRTNPIINRFVESVATFADISSATYDRLVRVAADETNNNDKTLYLYINGIGLELLQIIA